MKTSPQLFSYVIVVKRYDAWSVNTKVKRIKAVCRIVIYHINYVVLQGFPAMRKAVPIPMKKYDNFSCVFDITNQLLTHHSPFLHSLLLMNEWQSLHHSQFKVICRNFFGLWLLKRNLYRLQREKFSRRGRK